MVIFEETYECRTTPDSSFQVDLQRNVTDLYSQLEPTQRSFFEREMIAPQVLTNQTGPWPERRIVDYIAKNWGETSIPMQFYRSVFGLLTPSENNASMSTEKDNTIQNLLTVPAPGLEYHCK